MRVPRRRLLPCPERKNALLRAVGTSRGRYGPDLRPAGRAPVRARPRPGAGQRDRGAGAARHDRPGPARRTPRVSPVLGGRAPQHARHRELGATRADRPHRRRDHDHAGRLGRRDAAQPRVAGGGRAVRHAGGAPSRPDRPRHRARPGHRPGHRGRAAPLAGGVVRGRLPRPAHGPAWLLHRPLAGEPPIRPPDRGARPGQPARHVAARLERLQRPAGRPARPPVRLRAPLQRRQHAARASPVPQAFPPVGRAGSPVRDGRRRRGVRRDRRARPLPGRSGALAFLRLRSAGPARCPHPKRRPPTPTTSWNAPSSTTAWPRRLSARRRRSSAASPTSSTPARPTS